MPISTDVHLPHDHFAIFPSRCVGCGGNPEGNYMAIATYWFGWWSLVGIRGSKFSMHVPTCRKCVWRYRWGTVLRAVAYFMLVGATLYFSWNGFNAIAPMRNPKLTLIAATILASIVFWSVSLFFPRIVDVELESNGVVYEFRDSKYAHDFASLNEDAASIEVFGPKGGSTISV